MRGPRPRPGAALGSPAASCSPRRPGARTPPDDHCALTGSSNCWPSVAHTLLAHGAPSLLTGRYALGVLSPRMQKGKPRHGAGGWRWQTEAPHTRGAEVRAPAPYTPSPHSSEAQDPARPFLLQLSAGAGAVGSAEGFLTGEPEKGLRVWAQPGQQSRMTVRAPETNAQALRSLYTRPGPGQPGPGSRRGRRGCRVLAARPPALPQPAPLAARQGFKGCAEHAGAPGWNGLLKPRRENKGRPLRAGPREPVAGRGSQEKEGWVGTARCSQLPAPSGRSQAWPLHEEEPEARGRPCFGR